MTKWEYVILRSNVIADGTLAKEMNLLGSQHWELVSTHMDMNGTVLIFKRPLKS